MLFINRWNTVHWNEIFKYQAISSGMLILFVDCQLWRKYTVDRTRERRRVGISFQRPAESDRCDNCMVNMVQIKLDP